MKLLGPFVLHMDISNKDENYSLSFEWDEAFDSRGLRITRIDEVDGDPGSMTVIDINRTEAQQLLRYLVGCVNYRPLPDELS